LVFCEVHFQPGGFHGAGLRFCSPRFCAGVIPFIGFGVAAAGSVARFAKHGKVKVGILKHAVGGL